MLNTDSINFIFFGRLEKEKNFDMILDLIKKYWNNNKIKFFVIWKWYYSNELNSLKFSNLNYFGWKDKSFINEHLEKSHFSLMPSKFLETFWLTALESIKKWVPVIWFKKWWCKNFILKDLDISRQIGPNEKQKLFSLVDNLIVNFDNEKYLNWKNEINKISQNYSSDIRFNNFQKIYND